MSKNYQEWLAQAEYDINTAELLFNGERYFYTVFMCHLAIEKALKGIYAKQFNKTPTKTHNLLYLIEIINLQIPSDYINFIFTLNRVSVPTRYPENLQTMLHDYNEQRTKEMLDNSKELLKWLKTQ